MVSNNKHVNNDCAGIVAKFFKNCLSCIILINFIFEARVRSLASIMPTCLEIPQRERIIQC